jgi:hypothetical protein
MKALATHTPESLFDLETQNVVERPIDMVELTDEELDKVSGSWWGGFSPWFGGWGGFSPWFGGWGGFSPWFGGWGGFSRSFAFSSFSSVGW